MMKTMMMGMMAIIMIVGVIFAGIGVQMHQRVTVEEAKFHVLQSEYFIQSKEVRDAAETGSELNSQLVQIQNYPSELLRLKLVGVGNILTGIFVLLFGILIALIMMPVRLGKII
ncbi:MAG: hypothetical protein HY427_01375, partial [Candidatus Levybacteria bacterium]|nr:hypothetical protein [Candidatus Levybacteria bacterium]